MTSSQFSADFSSSQSEVTSVNAFYLIGTAGAPSYKVHDVFHLTVTPAGRLATDFDHFRVTCM